VTSWHIDASGKFGPEGSPNGVDAYEPQPGSSDPGDGHKFELTSDATNEAKISVYYPSEVAFVEPTPTPVPTPTPTPAPPTTLAGSLVFSSTEEDSTELVTAFQGQNNQHIVNALAKSIASFLQGITKDNIVIRLIQLISSRRLREERRLNSAKVQVDYDIEVPTSISTSDVANAVVAMPQTALVSTVNTNLQTAGLSAQITSVDPPQAPAVEQSSGGTSASDDDEFPETWHIVVLVAVVVVALLILALCTYWTTHTPHKAIENVEKESEKVVVAIEDPNAATTSKDEAKEEASTNEALKVEQVAVEESQSPPAGGAALTIMGEPEAEKFNATAQDSDPAAGPPLIPIDLFADAPGVSPDSEQQVVTESGVLEPPALDSARKDCNCACMS
jgi:hypothetical protein